MKIFFFRKNVSLETKEISNSSNVCIQISKSKKLAQTVKKNGDAIIKPIKTRNKSLPKGDSNLCIENCLIVAEKVNIKHFTQIGLSF